MIEVDLTPFSADELVQVAKVLAISMHANPVHIAVLRGQGKPERQRLEVMFLAMLRDRPGDVLLAKRQGAVVGVIRSTKCRGNRPSPALASRRPEENEARLVDIHARIECWKYAWDERDPQEPHRHLGPVGVLPQFQRMGLGSKMMEKFCELVDANGEPAFLETDSLANVRFYEKFRFHTVDESLVFGVRNFFMWRPAQQELSLPDAQGSSVNMGAGLEGIQSAGAPPLAGALPGCCATDLATRSLELPSILVLGWPGRSNRGRWDS